MLAITQGSGNMATLAAGGSQSSNSLLQPTWTPMHELLSSAHTQFCTTALDHTIQMNSREVEWWANLLSLREVIPHLLEWITTHFERVKQLVMELSISIVDSKAAVASREVASLCREEHRFSKPVQVPGMGNHGYGCEWRFCYLSASK